MGIDIGKIAKLHEELYLGIKKILKKNALDIHLSVIAKIMAEFFQNTIKDNIKLLLQVITGCLEN